VFKEKINQPRNFDMTTSAVVIITGGGGFLGQCLASSLLTKGKIQAENLEIPISKLVLADIQFSTLQPAIENAKSIVTLLQGDVSDTTFCDSIFLEIQSATHVSIFHLGAVMSGDGERDFDLCMRVNLHGFLNMIEGARQHIYSKLGFPAKFLFSSAGATIGSGDPTDHVTRDDVISDATRAAPHTTYGATKACCELLLSDYSRRGFVDGRGIRLPTIIVRAGAPNAATTGCFSGVVREPLAGVDVTLPLAPDVLHAVTGMRAAIDAMTILHNTPLSMIEQQLGFDRTVFLPATALSLRSLQEALDLVVTEETREKLGRITYDINETLSAVVESFPTKVDASRALKLGLPPAPDAEDLIREYINDFPAAVSEGIQILPPKNKSLSNSVIPSPAKVAIITGAGSGIGRAVAERLSMGDWTVVLVGRRLSTLHETQQLLKSDSSCSCVIQADVSVESDVERLFEMVQQNYGRIDLLFNNAGVNCSSAPVQDVKLCDFDRVLQTNVYGPFLCARAAMKRMANNGGGRIINNGSLSAHVPRPGSVCYSTSKHAVSGLTKCIALDGRSIGVACGQIDFGNVVSEMSLQTNKVGTGALQPNGSLMIEPSMTLHDAAEAVWTMANLPLDSNILQMTILATNMPFVGRG
jgi:D-erythronate 2-dehydrogenase